MFLFAVLITKSVKWCVVVYRRPLWPVDEIEVGCGTHD